MLAEEVRNIVRADVLKLLADEGKVAKVFEDFAAAPDESMNFVARLVRESLGPGQSVSVVARRNGINANQLFLLRKCQEGSLSAVSTGEAVVPASELNDALK